MRFPATCSASRTISPPAAGNDRGSPFNSPHHRRLRRKQEALNDCRELHKLYALPPTRQPFDVRVAVDELPLLFVLQPVSLCPGEWRDGAEQVRVRRRRWLTRGASGAALRSHASLSYHLDVFPQGQNGIGASAGVDSKHLRKELLQAKLFRLVQQVEQDGGLHGPAPFALDLKPIALVRQRRAVPLQYKGARKILASQVMPFPPHVSPKTADTPTQSQRKRPQYNRAQAAPQQCCHRRSTLSCPARQRCARDTM